MCLVGMCIWVGVWGMGWVGCWAGVVSKYGSGWVCVCVWYMHAVLVVVKSNEFILVDGILKILVISKI